MNPRKTVNKYLMAQRCKIKALLENNVRGGEGRAWNCKICQGTLTFMIYSKFFLRLDLPVKWFFNLEAPVVHLVFPSPSSAWLQGCIGIQLCTVHFYYYDWHLVGVTLLAACSSSKCWENPLLSVFSCLIKRQRENA